MRRERPWIGYACAVAATAACTAAGMAMYPAFDAVNIAMVYLLAVVVVALRFSRGAAITTSTLSIVAFNYFFVPPRFSFHVYDGQYLLTFAIMLAVALVISRLTRSVRRQAQAQAALELEAETERMRSALLASISHDVRTPLAVIAGASSSLIEKSESLTPETRTELARSIYEQSRDMSELVTKVLQMTRLESGAMRLDRDWNSLADIAGAVLRRLAERLSRHRVMVDIASDLPLLRVDATLIEQALGNLLENAARHTPAGTFIRLRAELGGAEVTVSVEDFGPGLAEADTERVFAKFQHSRPEGAGGGVGLGLAICRAIVRLHGGKAWAERIPGGGTAFRFTLPAEQPPDMPVEAPAPS